MRQRLARIIATPAGIALCGLLLAGCHSGHVILPADSTMPRELAKVSMPAYRVEPPDILLIDAVRVIPLPPYRIDPLDQLLIKVTGALTTDPIDGPYGVEPDGTVNLGIAYGTLRLVGMTLDEAKLAIETHLKNQDSKLKNPQAQLTLVLTRALQQIRGEHLVRMDGTIGLGTYGSVYVAGMTLREARESIERHLSRFILNPEISLDVLAYNSKVYYVITDGAGFGQQVFRLPVTGNETVLDAISNINGLPPTASLNHIWLARPSPYDRGIEQILPVDWHAITKGASTATNYQVLPGDRIYVKADQLITIDNTVAKIVSPIERLFGVTLLGSQTVRSFRTGQGGGGSGGF